MPKRFNDRVMTERYSVTDSAMISQRENVLIIVITGQPWREGDNLIS